MNPMNWLEIKQQVAALCEEVARYIRHEELHFDARNIEHKGFANLVSYVDKEAEKKLASGLLHIMPDAGFMGEEGSSVPSKNGYTWIVDPLDGTTNFMHHFPMYSISVALARESDLLVGVVYDVVHQECFHASQHGGAFCNEKKMHVTSTAKLSESLMATGFPYQFHAKKSNYMAIIQDCVEQTHGLRRLGSAALDLAYVAAGRLDGFFEIQLNPWDVAAGALLVQEAGGTVSNFSSEKDFLFGGELCAAGAIHPELISLINKRWNV